MSNVMMMLGAYPFMLDTAAYQRLSRVSSYRWKQQDRIGRKPAQHYVGPGADRITLRGEILPHWKGGL
ncbi:phage tail protein, partial [Ruegeria sp. 2012CJ41-6]